MRSTSKLTSRSRFDRQHLVTSHLYRTVPPGPPDLNDVIRSLRKNVNDRSSSDKLLLYRYLLFNQEINFMFGTAKQIDEASKEVEYVMLKRDEVLFYEGEDPDGWYLVVSGSVDVIIRYFIVAEDCLVESDARESQEFYNLMSKMRLDVTIDKLKRIKTLKNGQIFGQQSYLLQKSRSSTIIGVDNRTILMKFPGSLLVNTHAMIKLKNYMTETKALIKNVMPRLREDQLFHLNAFSRNETISKGKRISAKCPLSRSIYIIKQGTMKRLRIVDFTECSFMKFSAPFESLQLHFPDGPHPVHVDDLKVGSVFVDPSVRELTGNEYILKATSDVTLIAIDYDYFRIIVGSYETERIKQDLKTRFSDTEAIQCWIKSEKERLWKKFKSTQIKDAHRELKTARRAESSTVAIRIPAQPKSIKEYHPKKTIYYLSPSLRNF